jgi:hypothetical protein
VNYVSPPAPLPHLLPHSPALGAEGITSVDMDQRLMLNCKRGGTRLKELERRFGLQAQLINQVGGDRGVGGWGGEGYVGDPLGGRKALRHDKTNCMTDGRMLCVARPHLCQYGLQQAGMVQLLSCPASLP